MNESVSRYITRRDVNAHPLPCHATGFRSYVIKITGFRDGWASIVLAAEILSVRCGSTELFAGPDGIR